MISEIDLRRASALEKLFELDRRGPRRNGPAHMIPFVRAMSRGEITARLMRIPISCSQRALGRRLPLRMRESHDHMMLKASALLWMRDCGVVDAEEECDTGYYRYDVGSASFPWVIECGNVSADALRLAILDAVRPRFTIVPFQRRYEDWPKPLTAIDITWTTELSLRSREMRDRRMHQLAEIT